jgi:exonuclease VII large subunit
MALFFQTRDRPELNRSEQVKEAREYVCPVDRTTNEKPVGYAARLGSLMQRLTEPSLQQIDDLVAELRRGREHLLSETALMQRELVEYAKLSQRTAQSTTIGTQQLLGLKERSKSKVAASARDNDKTLEGQAEPTAAPSSSEKTIRSLELKLERLERGLAMPRDEDAIARTKALLEEARAVALG